MMEESFDIEESFNSVLKRVHLHDELITASYDEKNLALSEKERDGLRNLAQMVADGTTVFTANEFGSKFGMNDEDAIELLEKLRIIPYERTFTMPDGAECEVSGLLANMTHLRVLSENGKCVDKFELTQIATGQLIDELIKEVDR